MPSTYTVNLGIEKPATGEQSGTWGDTTNVNFDILDQAINGAVVLTLANPGTSGTPNLLEISNGSTSDGRNKWIELTDAGDLGGTSYLRLDPNDAEKIVFVRNNLSGGQSAILFQGTYSTSNDFEVPAGCDVVLKFDGNGTSATVVDVYNKLRVTALTTPLLTTADIETSTISANDGTLAINIANTTGAVDIDTSLNVDGIVTSDGLTVDGNATVTGTVTADGLVVAAGAYGTLLTAGGTNGYISVSNPSENLVTAFTGTSDVLALGTSNTERMRIDANGAVGVNYSNPSLLGTLVVGQTVDGKGIAIADSTKTNTFFLENDGTQCNIRNNDAAPIVFSTNLAERMRIDSSGNLLVGTTDTSLWNDNADNYGHNILANGQYYSSTDGEINAYLNRQNSDGAILAFAKDGTTVGSIGTVDGDLNIYASASGHKGLRFGNGYIAPTSNSTSIEDATTSLGLLAARFKDLHLSGTANAAALTSSGALDAASAFIGPAGYNIYLRNVSGTNRIDSYNDPITATVPLQLNASQHAFYIADAEKARLDSSGNLLVGKTAVSLAAVGVEVKPSGEVRATASSAAALQLNRLGTDGEIIDFRRSGVTVGSWLTRAALVSTIILDPRPSGVGLSGGGPFIYPTDNAGAISDGAIGIGTSGTRFKDIYLSGGVYLGGTGAANKLDDYEEGNFSGTVGGGGSDPTTPVIFTGSYIKVGRMVTVRWRGSNFDNTGASGVIVVRGMPYSAQNEAVGSGWGGRSASPIIPYIGGGTNYIQMLTDTGNGNNWASTGTGTYMSFTVTYFSN
jgi:cytoskeletal protein CcmA (bactofilin family)